MIQEEKSKKVKQWYDWNDSDRSFFLLQRPSHKNNTTTGGSPPHALSLLARLQPVLQRSLHLRQVRYGDVQGLAGGRGGGEVVGVFPSIGDQKDSGDWGVLRHCGHGVKFHVCQLNAAQQNSTTDLLCQNVRL